MEDLTIYGKYGNSIYNRKNYCFILYKDLKRTLIIKDVSTTHSGKIGLKIDEALAPKNLPVESVYKGFLSVIVDIDGTVSTRPIAELKDSIEDWGEIDCEISWYPSIEEVMMFEGLIPYDSVSTLGRVITMVENRRPND